MLLTHLSGGDGFPRWLPGSLSFGIIIINRSPMAQLPHSRWVEDCLLFLALAPRDFHLESWVTFACPAAILLQIAKLDWSSDFSSAPIWQALEMSG